MQDIQNKFTEIYAKDLWHGGSGPGSSIEFTKEYIKVLLELINKKEIKNCIDYGCGDWQFSKTIPWNRYVDTYTGVDIVDNLIKEHKSNYESENVKFTYLKDFNFFSCDLIICKDVLQHLPTKIIKNLLDEMMNNGKYLLITNDYKSTKQKQNSMINQDCEAGGWRPINLFLEPFNLQGTVIWQTYKTPFKHSILIKTKE